MKQNKLTNRIATKFGITHYELLVVLFLSIGLIIGLIYKTFFRNSINYSITVDKNYDILKTLDSIAEIHQTTFIGSNIENEPVSELLAKDTVVKKTEKIKAKKSDFKGIININIASKSQLMRLYRVGEKTAEKIIEYRNKNPFTKKEDIMKVKGIGKGTFEKIKDNISVQ